MPDDKPVKMSLEETWESGSFFSESHIDRASRIISNVTLLGRISRNGRRYSENALKDAARLYEGVPFYMDHPTQRELKDREGARSVLDLAGRIRNPRLAGDQVRGDIEVLDREPMNSLIFALAEQMPGMVGNSHRASGRVTRGDDGEVVEGIDAVAAVELVTNPATTRGLFESLDLFDSQEDEMEIKDLKLEALKESRPDLVKAILAEHKGTEQVAALQAENERLKEEAEKREAEDAKRERKEFIEAALKKSKLPLDNKKVVTEEFRSQLEEMDSEHKVTAAIEDRAQLFDAAKRSTTRSIERTEEPIGERTKIEEADFGNLADRIFV